MSTPIIANPTQPAVSTPDDGQTWSITGLSRGDAICLCIVMHEANRLKPLARELGTQLFPESAELAEAEEPSDSDVSVGYWPADDRDAVSPCFSDFPDEAMS